MTDVVPVRNMEMQSPSALTVTSRDERSALAAMASGTCAGLMRASSRAVKAACESAR